MIDHWFAVTSAMKRQNSLKSVVILFNLNIEGPSNVIKRIMRSFLRTTINVTAQETLWSSHEKASLYIYEHPLHMSASAAK